MSSTFRLSSDRALAIAEAQKTLSALESYWPQLERCGATTNERKLLQDRLARAIVLHDTEPEELTPTLAELRPEVADLIGSMRAHAQLVGYGAKSVDKVALAQLKAEGRFPGNDKAVMRWWVDLPKALKKYSTQLAQRGFSKEEQARLVDRMTLFEKLVKDRSVGKSERKKSSIERDEVFADLRWITGYFRRVGRTALRNSPERMHFDRVSSEERKTGKKPEPSPSVPQQTQAASINGASGGTPRVQVVKPAEAGAPN